MSLPKNNKYIINILFCLYLALLVFVLFGRQGEDISVSFTDIRDRLVNESNLVPFNTVKRYINAYNNSSMSHTLIRINLIGNFLLFVPYPIFISLLSKKKSFWRALLVTLLCIMAAELIQIITGLGRLDIDDIILNTSGAVVVYLPYHLLYKLTHIIKRR